VIKFLLNQTEHSVSDIDPNITVLDYLREHLHKKGSKEGCASGDCGACTAVLGESEGEAMRYKSINACITLLASLHGKQLITVEDLKTGKQLHPVQQAMVDCHGSQCGFCTPGFVMSMFAYRKNNLTPTRAGINEALGGNLCRCTGYRPIVEAAVQMFEPDATDQFTETETAVTKKLNQIKQIRNESGNKSGDKSGDQVVLSAQGRTFYSPATITELANLLLKYPNARLIAGGTDLSLELTQFLRNIDVLIYTGRAEGLDTVEETESQIDIGSAATYSKAKNLLVQYFPDLEELIERLGSRQIRNQGTIGGNVGNASPIGDMPPVLIALGAQLVLRKGDTTRIIDVADYFVKYKVTSQQTSEFIERILIPKPQPNEEFRVYKISKRMEDDISASCGAFNIEIEKGFVKRVAIAYGGMAEIPKRATHCEKSLLNQVWNEHTIQVAMAELAKDFSPINDFRASAEYRLLVSQNFLQRLFLEINSSHDTLRVSQYA